MKPAQQQGAKGEKGEVGNMHQKYMRMQWKEENAKAFSQWAREVVELVGECSGVG